MAIVAPNSQNLKPGIIGAAGSHPSDDDLELYSLGMIQEEGQLAQFEEHLLTCGNCVDRAIQIEDWVRTMKNALRTEPERTWHAKLEKPN